MLNPSWEEEWSDAPRPASRTFDSFVPKLSAEGSLRLPIWEFAAADGARLYSRRPVEVKVTKEVADQQTPDPTYVFSCESLHVFSSAATYDAALSSFHEQVVHFYFAYRDTDTRELAQEAANIQVIYRTYFRELPR
ncbi:MAG TPA: hypothetical protein VGI91_12795 [Steroidobacteraceae bacterium]|jgi:hypothetical protein